MTNAESIVIEVKRPYQISKGSLDVGAYMNEAYGFYDEGYVAGPLIEGDGVISFKEGGELVFSKDNGVHHMEPLLEHWQTKRELQMLDVRTNAILQLLKNLPLANTLLLCGGDKIRSYSQFWNAMGSLDPAVVIETLEKLLPELSLRS